MTIEFTENEVNLIVANRKPLAEKPSFYNSQTKEEQKISDDFEAYLILQEKSEKQKILQWIRRTIDIQIDTADRDKLLETYVGNRKKDAQLRLSELDVESQKFAAFREDLAASGDRRFDSVIELNLLTSTLQKPIDQLVIQRDSAFHELNLIAILETRLSEELSDENTKKELDSWQTVLSAYDGVAGGSVNGA